MFLLPQFKCILIPLQTNISYIVYDPYYNYVILNISGNSTLSANNNTFIDSSTNNQTVTRTNQVVQGSFNPFDQNKWDVYFNGSSYLSASNNAAFEFGSGDFTIECWTYHNITSHSGTIINLGNSTSSNAWGMRFNSGTGFIFFDGTDRILSNVYTVGTWVHIAVTRSGTSLKIFFNGTQVGSTYTSTTNFATGYRLLIGKNVFSGYDLIGYISNLRLIKGQAIYTGNFTPPSTKLTSNTIGTSGVNVAASLTGTVSLLTCQSNRFVDNSTNQHKINLNGTPSIQTFNPFLSGEAYNPTLYGGSGYFDGNSRLTVPAGSNFQYGTGQFTIEAWVYCMSFSSEPIWFSQTVAGNNYLLCNISNAGFINFTGEGVSVTATLNALTLSSWNHIAIVREGIGTGQLKLYSNGTLAGSGTITSNFTDTTRLPSVGAYTHTFATNTFTGYIASLRIVKGSAVYTSNFTPSIYPLSSVSGTSLLLNFANGGIVDMVGSNNINTFGNVKISNITPSISPSPSIGSLNSGSMYFDGSANSYLQIKDNPIFEFGSGSFTIEFRIRFTNVASTTQVLYDARPPSTQGLYIVLALSTVNKISFQVNTPIVIASTTTIQSNIWYHIALVKSSSIGKTYLFINGTNEGEYVDNNSYLNASNRPILGTSAFNTAFGLLSGYMDDFRITRGIARYTSNFTVSAQESPIQ